MKRKIKGFTLVELAVTLITIIVLMSVSVPIYTSNTKKFKQAEGYALLAAIRSAQEQYYAEYGNFLSSKDGSGSNGKAYAFTSNEEVLRINARTNKYFTRFSVNSNGNFDTDGKFHYAGGDDLKYRFLACVTGSAGCLKLSYDLELGTKITENGTQG